MKSIHTDVSVSESRPKPNFLRRYNWGERSQERLEFLGIGYSEDKESGMFAAESRMIITSGSDERKVIIYSADIGGNVLQGNNLKGLTSLQRVEYAVRDGLLMDTVRSQINKTRMEIWNRTGEFDFVLTGEGVKPYLPSCSSSSMEFVPKVDLRREGEFIYFYPLLKGLKKEKVWSEDYLPHIKKVYVSLESALLNSLGGEDES